MNMNRKTSILIAFLIVAIIVVGWGLLAKGGLFAVQLPQASTINPSALSANSVPTDGAVLGESETPTYTNPLNDIYVNPFEK